MKIGRVILLPRLLASLALVLAVASTPGRARAADPSEYQGFGAATPGGAGQPIYRVVTLDNSGPGSLREALSAGYRTVVFDVAGDIVLSSDIHVRGPFVTIDGFTAPTPGITVRNYGLRIRNDEGAHDVIVRGVRIRDAAEDGIQVAGGAYNVVIDHVSVHNSGDGNIDVTQVGTRDVTVSWSVLAEPAGEEKNMLLAFKQVGVTLHHNIFVAAQQRSPQVTYDDSLERTQSPETTLDMRNNLVWNWRGGYGTRIRYGAKANIVNNYYGADGGDAEDALIICQGLAVDPDCGDDPTNVARAYVSGNVSRDGVGLNGRGTETIPFPAPAVDIEDALSAACDALENAGVRPLDAVDQQYLAAIDLPCVAPPPPPPPSGGFVDSFDRPDSSELGGGWTEAQGEFTIQSGELRNAAIPMFQIAALPGILEGATQVVAASFASVNNNLVPRFGLILRYQDPRNYYLLYRQTGGSSVLRISRVVNGVETILRRVTVRNPSTNTFFRLAGRAEGSTLTLSLNEVTLSAEDSTFARGSVGVLMGGKGGKSHRADNFSAQVAD